MTEPTIAGEPLSHWEHYLHEVADGSDAATGFRGVVVDTNRAGVRLAWPQMMPTDPWLGINTDGTRVTIAQYRERRGM